MSQLDFRAFEPPTLQTFGAVWRNKVFFSLLKAIAEYRLQEYTRTYWWLGRASTAVSCLYDINHPESYHLLCRYNQVKALLDEKIHEDVSKEH